MDISATFTEVKEAGPFELTCYGSHKDVQKVTGCNGHPMGLRPFTHCETCEGRHILAACPNRSLDKEKYRVAGPLRHLHFAVGRSEIIQNPQSLSTQGAIKKARFQALKGGCF